MSISPALKASARSAYRNLYRASSITFAGETALITRPPIKINPGLAGDDYVLKAFRTKMRADSIVAQAVSDPEVYKQHSQLAREIADVLRKNIVQAAKVPEDNEIWRLRLTQDTELGSNETIKSPPPIDKSSRTMRKRERNAQQTLTDDTTTDAAPHSNQNVSSPPARPTLNYSALKKAHKERIVPELREEDLEESFVRGSGPGGQSINKTENNVQLLHKPTGIRVSCQETRSLALNRRLARRLIVEKLDKLMNPGLSKQEFQRAKQRERERRRRKKAKKKALQREIEDSEHSVHEN